MDNEDLDDDLKINQNPCTFFSKSLYFVLQTNSFSKCSTCVSIEKELEKTRDPAVREKLKKMISVHNARQM